MAKSKKKPAKKAVKKSAQKKSSPSTSKAKSKIVAKPAKKAQAKGKAAKPKVTAKPKSKPQTGKAKANVIAMDRARTKKAADLSSFFTPLDDRVLVQRMGLSDRTPGGLYIPDTASSSDKPTQGRVVAVGRGHLSKKGKLQPLDVQLGDLVLFNSFAGSEVKIENEDMLLLRENEILGVMKG